ncbi:hypothetical protein Tco_1213109 [Tanacetum coccineum]
MFSLVWIMPPKVMTQSASRPTAAPRGRGTGRRVGREGRRVRESRRRKVEPNYEGEGQGNDQGVEVNDGVDGGDVRNVIENNDHRGCTYKDSLACNPKGYDGKGGAIVYTRWIEKIESVQDMSRCRDSQKVKYTVGSFVRMVAAIEPKTIQKAVQIAGTLTDEAIRNRSIKKNHEKRGNGGETSKDRNGRDDNKRTRPENAFATTTNPVRRENTGTAPKVVPRNVNPVNARNPTASRRACYECRGTDHFKAACPRLNQTPRLGGNCPNQALAIDGR